MIKGGDEDLEKSIHFFNVWDKKRHRLGEESEVSQYNNEEGIMKHDGPKPQPLGRFIFDLLPTAKFKPCVPEQGTETKDLQDHPADNGQGADRVIQFVDISSLEPGQRFLLPTRGRDAKRHRAFRPLHHPVDHPDKKYDYSKIRNHHPKKPLEMCPPHAHESNCNKPENCRGRNYETQYDVHLVFPRFHFLGYLLFTFIHLALFEIPFIVRVLIILGEIICQTCHL